MALNGAGKETPQEDKQRAGTSLQHSVLYGLIGIQSQCLCQFPEEEKDKEPQLEDVGLSRFSEKHASGSTYDGTLCLLLSV